jgi:hypothetical protein
VLRLVDEHRPLHVSIVGGEPLVRYRELDAILPVLSNRGIYVQLVTSAVREIPAAWCDMPRVQVVVSVDGLPAEHDVRRAPATYSRLLKHIAGRRIIVHCTITRQQVRRPGYLEEFVAFWSAKDETEQIRMSLYTPQIGEVSEEMLDASDRSQVIADLMALGIKYRKLVAPKAVLDVYADPPQSPRECTFAQTTLNVSADLETSITPCVFGGAPDCANCGCLASAGLAAIERHRILGVIPVGALFKASLAVGEQAKRWRHHNGASHGTPLSGNT